MKIKFEKLITIVAVLLGVILIINIFLTSSLGKAIDKKIGIAKEAAKPAKIGLIIIKNSKCDDCFDISLVIDSLKKSSIEIIKEVTLELNSEEAKGLINRYNIKKIPSILLLGEINKTNFRGFEKKENALLFTQTLPPYTDAVTKEIKGRVSLINIDDSSCDKCTDLTELIREMELAGVAVTEEKTIDFANAKDLIEKYDIEKIPALIISKDLEEYQDITAVWENIGTVEDDGSYVTRLINAPYLDVDTNKIIGLVDVIYLTDNSCKDCYDVKLHKPILLGFGLGLENENTVDISSNEGKNLIEKYNISLVPTIILSKDANAYIALQQVWQGVGTVEDDGSYVFREVGVMGGSYKNLTTNKIVTPSSQTAGTS